MPHTERLQFLGPAVRAAHRGRAAATPARTPFAPAVEQALLFGLFSGGAGFWLALICWIVR